MQCLSSPNESKLGQFRSKADNICLRWKEEMIAGDKSCVFCVEVMGGSSEKGRVNANVTTLG